MAHHGPTKLCKKPCAWKAERKGSALCSILHVDIIEDVNSNLVVTMMCMQELCWLNLSHIRAGLAESEAVASVASTRAGQQGGSIDIRAVIAAVLGRSTLPSGKL